MGQGHIPIYGTVELEGERATAHFPREGHRDHDVRFHRLGFGATLLLALRRTLRRVRPIARVAVDCPGPPDFALLLATPGEAGYLLVPGVGSYRAEEPMPIVREGPVPFRPGTEAIVHALRRPPSPN